MNDLIKKAGTFKIHRDLIREGNSENLLKLFANTIIVRAEHMFIGDYIEYGALSPLFRIKEDYEDLPEYEIIFNTLYSDEGPVDVVVTAKEKK